LIECPGPVLERWAASTHQQATAESPQLVPRPKRDSKRLANIRAAVAFDIDAWRDLPIAASQTGYVSKN
jgi:hypothetical protein